MKRYYIFFVILVVVCALAIASNILLRRGPAHDATAASDISQFQSEIYNYYDDKGELPESLDQIDVANTSAANRLGNYQYQRTSELTYKICTTFETNHHTSDTYAPKSDEPNPDQHGKGLQCFSYNVLPIEQNSPTINR